MNNIAYVGDLKWMRAIDITEPSKPRNIASYETPGYTDEIAVVDENIYVANYDAGLMILALKDRDSPRVASHPNQTNHD